MRAFDLKVKTGEYQNQQGETKGEYITLGVVMRGDNGYFAILDPSVNLAGCLLKQNQMNATNGKAQRDGLMVSLFDPAQQGQQQMQQGQRSHGHGPAPTYQHNQQFNQQGGSPNENY